MIKDRKNRSVVAVAFIAVILLAMFVPYLWEHSDNGDVGWNAGAVKNITDGLVPYRDFNMLQMPLWAYLGAFLGAGRTMIAFRILSILSFVVCFLMHHALMRRAYNPISSVLLTAAAAACMLRGWMFSYSSLLIVCVFGIFLVYLYMRDTWKRTLAAALICGCTVCMKQTVGFCICLAFAVIELIAFALDRKDRKNVLRRLWALAVFLPFLATMTILCISAGSLSVLGDWYDCCVAALFEFGGNCGMSIVTYMRDGLANTVMGFAEIVLAVAEAATVIRFVIGFVRRKHTAGEDEWESGRTVLYLILISAGGATAMIPIFDACHIFYGLLAFSVPCLFISAEKRKKRPKKDSSAPVYPDGRIGVTVACAVLSVLIAVIPTVSFWNTNILDADGRQKVELEESDFFGGAWADKNMIAYCRYVKDIRDKHPEALIVCTSARIQEYLGDYVKYWNCLLYGNVGTATSEEMYRSAEDATKKQGKTEIWFVVNKQMCWQLDLEALDYMQSRCYEISNNETYSSVTLYKAHVDGTVTDVGFPSILGN